MAVSLDGRTARLAAISECVEAYCSMAPPRPEVLVRSCFQALGAQAVSPRRFPQLSPRQYRNCPRLSRLTDETVVDWCWSYSITHRRPVLVPAGFVYFSCGRRPPNDTSPEMVSTGLACHASIPDAVLAGLCEVVERDALAISWHARLAHTPLDVTGTAVEDLLAGYLSSCGIDFQLFQVPTDTGLPVVLALGRSESEQPHAVVGSACRPDPIAAAVKALFEACQVLGSLRGKQSIVPPLVRTVLDHAAFYATAEGRRLLDRHLVVSEDVKPITQIAGLARGSTMDDLDAVVQAVAARGLEVVVHELTTSDVLEAGLRVLRVLIPGMIDMAVDTRFLKLQSPRFEEVPRFLGTRQRPLPERSLNLLPLPLA